MSREIINNSKKIHMSVYRSYSNGTPNIYVDKIKHIRSNIFTIKKAKPVLFGKIT